MTRGNVGPYEGQPGSSIAGVLLAGGQSRRMFADGPGGGDKGLLALDDRPMLQHVIDRLAPQVGTLAINANGDPQRFAAFHLPVVADTVGGYVGPLAGVLAGLRWAKAAAPDATHIATASTDAPFLPADLVARLAAALALAPQGERIALARSDGHLHPVIGLWPIELADDLERSLAAGVRKVLAWTDRHGTLGVDFGPQRIGGQDIDPFFNANTPDDLELARRLLDVEAASHG
ncbi:MAG: molybdenum cofactor guanylyltransferase MobA [Hyphomicrobiaceae bacterium]|nr:molybdenum cofactor guanylyltransferase MobA [Hyphomicrobiaceae bacterium]